MRDVTPEDRVFVSTVERNPGIDQVQLLKELNLACLHLTAKGEKFKHDARDVDEAMIWAATPQGTGFWIALFEGRGLTEWR